MTFIIENYLDKYDAKYVSALRNTASFFAYTLALWPTLLPERLHVATRYYHSITQSSIL
jgi:hypothetical protein